jgi:hypothetical protein
MGKGKLRGEQIKDESIESVDLASGSINAGELNQEAISGQALITSADATNDRLLAWDATDSALKRIAPQNLFGGVSATDTNLFVSGAIGSKGHAETKGTATFGGDVAVSGSLFVGCDANAVPASRALDVYANVSGDYAAVIDNDENSAGHVMKLTTDGTGNGTYVLDMESSSDTIFRARADGRFGFGSSAVGSMGAGTFVVGIDGGHTSDIAISKRLQHLGDGNTYMDFPSTDQLQFVVGGVDMLHVTEDDTQDMIVFNEGGADVDFRVESDGKPHALFVDGGTNQVLILSGGVAASYDEAGGADVNFYVSGSVGSRSSNTRGTSVFGGDAYVSGNLNCAGNLYVADNAGMYTDKIRRYSGQDNTTKILLNNDHIKLYSGHSSNNIVGIGDTSGADCNFRVSGSIGSRTTTTRGTATFEGDLVVSGGLAVDGSTLVIDEAKSLVGIGTGSPNSTFHVSGSQAGNYTDVSTSGAGALTFGASHFIVNYTGNGDAVFTLPDVSKITGRQYHILHNCQGDIDVLTVTGSGGQFLGVHLEGPQNSVNINGSTPQSISIVSTGDNWFILHDGRSQG